MKKAPRNNESPGFDAQSSMAQSIPSGESVREPRPDLLADLRRQGRHDE